ncbi:iron/manganese transport system membrane protein SitD [Escherichia coli]|nr:iron/manganese transport system membrane protein SitD [Escherichia coli]
MMALLLEPLQFTFMSHALLISLVVSIPCALLSVFLVLKGWALMGDAMSHAVFPGIVLTWILGLPLATGAFRRRSILRGGDGIPERQQPNQARYSYGDCFFWHVCRRSDLVYCNQTRRTS